MEGIFNNKIWIMDPHTFEHWQNSSRHGRIVEKSGTLLQIEKVPEASDGDLTCYVFSLEDALALISVTNPSGILTIEK